MPVKKKQCIHKKTKVHNYFLMIKKRKTLKTILCFFCHFNKICSMHVQQDLDSYAGDP